MASYSGDECGGSGSIGNGGSNGNGSDGSITGPLILAPSPSPTGRSDGHHAGRTPHSFCCPGHPFR